MELDQIHWGLGPSGHDLEGQPVLFVNDEPLDSWVAHRTDLDRLRGLAPALDRGYLVDGDDWHHVQDRALPLPGSSSVLPVLVCPEDMDLYCETVFVEVNPVAGAVRWERFGVIDGRRAGVTSTRAGNGLGVIRSAKRLPAVADDVDWLPASALAFERDAYVAALSGPPHLRPGG